MVRSARLDGMFVPLDFVGPTAPILLIDGIKVHWGSTGIKEVSGARFGIRDPRVKSLGSCSTKGRSRMERYILLHGDRDFAVGQWGLELVTYERRAG